MNLHIEQLEPWHFGAERFRYGFHPGWFDLWMLGKRVRASLDAFEIIHRNPSVISIRLSRISCMISFRLGPAAEAAVVRAANARVDE